MTLKGFLQKIFTAKLQRAKDFGFFCFSLTQRNRLRIPQGRDAEKQNDSTLRVIKCRIGTLEQIIDAFCRFRSVSCLEVFQCRPLNGNGKIVILCVLCVSSEAGGKY